MEGGGGCGDGEQRPAKRQAVVSEPPACAPDPPPTGPTRGLPAGSGAVASDPSADPHPDPPAMDVF
ncbi:hypothetical protein PLESTM_000680100 [Pleodorina starrii]|nr:hypothetical protein PLESTM_000680100 [Pleodorina starrii]